MSIASPTSLQHRKENICSLHNSKQKRYRKNKWINSVIRCVPINSNPHPTPLFPPFISFLKFDQEMCWRINKTVSLHKTCMHVSLHKTCMHVSLHKTCMHGAVLFVRGKKYHYEKICTPQSWHFRSDQQIKIKNKDFLRLLYIYIYIYNLKVHFTDYMEMEGSFFGFRCTRSADTQGAWKTVPRKTTVALLVCARPVSTPDGVVYSQAVVDPRQSWLTAPAQSQRDVLNQVSISVVDYFDLPLQFF